MLLVDYTAVRKKKGNLTRISVARRHIFQHKIISHFPSLNVSHKHRFSGWSSTLEANQIKTKTTNATESIWACDFGSRSFDG